MLTVSAPVLATTTPLTSCNAYTIKANNTTFSPFPGDTTPVNLLSSDGGELSHAAANYLSQFPKNDPSIGNVCLFLNSLSEQPTDAYFINDTKRPVCVMTRTYNIGPTDILEIISYKNKGTLTYESLKVEHQHQTIDDGFKCTYATLPKNHLVNIKLKTSNQNDLPAFLWYPERCTPFKRPKCAPNN